MQKPRILKYHSGKCILHNCQFLYPRTTDSPSCKQSTSATWKLKFFEMIGVTLFPVPSARRWQLAQHTCIWGVPALGSRLVVSSVERMREKNTFSDFVFDHIGQFLRQVDDLLFGVVTREREKKTRQGCRCGKQIAYLTPVSSAVTTPWIIFLTSVGLNLMNKLWSQSSHT